MGKKGNWFSAVKKALSPEPKEKKDKVFELYFLFLVIFLLICLFVVGFDIEKSYFPLNQISHKSKRKWFGKHKSSDPVSSFTENAMPIPAPAPAVEDVKLTEAENEQSKHAYSVALATAVAAEAAVAAAQAAAEVVRLTAATRFSGKSREEVAAIKIQTAFRGFMVLLIILFTPKCVLFSLFLMSWFLVTGF